MTAATAIPPIVLSIAGSDTSAGAGVQADSKTITACGCYAMTAITALTAQGPDGVRNVWPVSATQLQAQIRAALDYRPAAIKTGMLGNAALVQALIDSLQARSDIPLVIDPVLVSSSGAALLDDEGAILLRDHLLPLATLITPNHAEARVLFGDNWRNTLPQWAQQHGCAVLVTGGDTGGITCTDTFFHDGGEQDLQAPRIATRNNHGTGCTLASAIASCIALGATVPEAVQYARDYVRSALAGAQQQVWPGRGPLQHASPHTVFRSATAASTFHS